MKKSYTRVIAFLLSVVMCVGLLPVTSFAAAGQTFPAIDSLTKNEGAKLVADRNSNYDRTVTGVEHIEYDKPKEEDGEIVVGELTIYINEAMQGDFEYMLSTNALNVTFKGVPEGYGTDPGFVANQFSAKKTEGHSGAFAFDEAEEILYVYRVKIKVAEKSHDYPVLQSLTLSDKAILTGKDDTVSILGAAYINYPTVKDGKYEGDDVKIAGEITLYVGSALKPESTYALASDALNAEFTNVSGYVSDTDYRIQGSFNAGQDTAVSSYYAYLEEDETMYCYDLKVVAGYPDNDNVYLKDGVGARIAPTRARVSFNANQAGTYHYAVVDAAAAAPTMPMDAGAAMTAGENTFVIDELAEGAKKVYIWGKNGEKVSARPVVVEIGATAKSYSLTFGTTTAATDGIFRITADDVDVSFRTRIMVTPTTTAKEIYEGQRITVWMGNPHTNKDLDAVKLNPDIPVTIAPDKNSFSFTMPAADVYGTSNDWRTYVDSTKTRYTLTGKASTVTRASR